MSLSVLMKKNIEDAEKTGEYEVHVPRWGMHFTTEEPVWWRLAKDARPQEFPRELGIEPKNIMLLYE